MTLPQMFAFGLIAVLMAAFVWGRFRYDLVAMLGLVAGIAVGIVPFDKAFSGFSDDVVVIVAGALITSKAVAASGIAERLMRRMGGWLSSPARQVGFLSALVMVLSGFVKNIGAVSMLMPSAYQMAQKSGTPLSLLLMPMSFASLIGGLVTLVGTSPNVIVSRIRQDITGEPFRMFDFTPVGLPLALMGLVFLVFAYRLLPVRRAPASADAALEQQGYTIEAMVLESSAVAGRPVSELAAMADGAVTVTSLIRDVHKRFRNPATQQLRPGDHVMLEGKAADLDALVSEAGLKLPRIDDDGDGITSAEEKGLTEAVITADSMLVGWSPSQLRLFDRFNVNVVGVQRRGERVQTRLKTFRFAVGDMVVLRGNIEVMPETLSALGLLPLAARHLAIGRARNPVVPVGILLVAMVLMAMKVISVPVAFMGAAVLIVALGALTLREAYDALDPPVLVTLAALIPISDSLRSTGATDLISTWLSAGATSLPPIWALALIMVVAMAVTPFLNNAATVLVAGPIAATFAKQLGYNPDPFLMAVAIGAACDFLTPIGHQCNMLVMGPGNYRFGDYWRLGLPLSILVVAAGVPLIAWFWPLVK
jgi:di/tricarboxylate transporter